MALLDTIRKNLAANQKQQAATDQVGQTERATSLLRQRSTGKATTESASAASNIGEQTAAGQTRQGLQQIQQQGDLASRQLSQRSAEMTQKTDIQQAQLEQARASTDGKYRRETDKIINDLSRSGRELDLNRDAAKLEQLGHVLAMQDKQYVETLQLSGAKYRLTNELNFQVALQKDIWADMQGLFKDEIDLKKFLAMDQREFEQKLMKMDMKDAYKIFQMNQEAANKQAIWSALGMGGTAGAEYYGNTGTTTTTPTTSTQTNTNASVTGPTNYTGPKTGMS